MLVVPVTRQQSPQTIRAFRLACATVAWFACLPANSSSTRNRWGFVLNRKG